MSFNVLTFEQIRDNILRDIANQNTKAVTGRDSDYRVRANASAAAVEGLYQHQAWIARQVFPSTSDEDYLERHAAEYLVTRKPASAATGSITFTGTPGAAINVGTECKTLDESAYVTAADGIIPEGGSLTLAAAASVAGISGNQEDGSSVTLTSAPAGVLSSATIVTMTSGTDKESNTSLLSRLQARKKNPPAGGNKSDHEQWALEVPGVTQSWCYPLRRGVKTVDVAVLSNGEPPSAELLETVQQYMDDVRPVGGDFLALSPQKVLVDITATLTLRNGYTIEQVAYQAQVLQAAYFTTLAPGDTAYKSRIFSLLSDIEGVIDVSLTAPVANVLTTVDATHVEIPALGALNLTEDI